MGRLLQIPSSELAVPDVSPRATTGTLTHVRLEWPRRIAVLAYFACSAWYFYWRLGTLNPDAMFFSVLILGAEFYGVVTAGMHIFMCNRLTTRTPPAPPINATVDVLIPTYNESPEIVRRTLIAAAGMNYPHVTWLLDDGNRSEMRALADELGCRYLARTDNAHAKAGNLNNALKFADGEFVVVFDADHAPRQDFLLRTLGYFQDPQVAFVQTPQDFYNLDSYQHRSQKGRRLIWTEQSLFFRIIQRGKDYCNAAFYCGSCAVVRRTALDSIGGFATETVTEDLHTSIRMHAKGFRSVYHAESLAFGIAPESVEPFLSQRIRWGQGAMQVWKKERILTNPGLTFAQKINYFASMATYFDGWQKAIFYLAPAFVLATGTMPIVTSTEAFLLHFVPYFLLTFLVFEEVGRGYGRSLLIEQYNMARFWAFAWSTLGLLFDQKKFKVTPKGQNSNTWRWWSYPQLGVLALNALAMPVGLLAYAYYQHLPTNGLVANMIWAGANCTLALLVVFFNRTSGSNLRTVYRFPIPLPTIVRFADQNSVVGTIDDISPSGFRLYARFPEALQAGHPIAGHIHFPGFTVPFRGQVRGLIRAGSGEQSYVKAVGCTMEIDTASKDAINAFLYGSDAQWRLNDFSEQNRTPLSRLMPRRIPEGMDGRLASLRWTAARIDGAREHSATEGLSLLSVATGESRTRHLLSFSYLGDGRMANCRVFARTASAELRLCLEFVESIGAGQHPIYIYRAKEC